jgi:hypothetical protein
MRCLRFNWQQRMGFLVEDLDGAPYLHRCANRPYAA